MDKEKILSKIAPRDYHNELEMILEDKTFSEDVKNLLLSCIYKIETGYHDYEIVKRVTLSKKEYLEEILNIIKEKCNYIEIEKENVTNIEELVKARYEIDRIEGKITLWHPNEKIILYAIYELDDNQIYVDEKYSHIRMSLSELLNKGENMNRLEVLRDFNGWNWNTDSNEMQNITINLVYQNLISLLGISFMEQWIHSEKLTDYLALAQEKISNEYGQENAKEIFKWISRIALITCIQTNEKEKDNLLQEKNELEKELARMENKKELLEEISKKKKEALLQIKEIDKILNDKKLLQEEYVKRNERLPEYHKIFSLAHLSEVLTKQRKKIMLKIEEENKILEPVYYVKTKTRLQEEIDLLSCLDLSKEKINTKIVSYSILLQKAVMNCLKKRIQSIEKMEKTSKKEELIKQIYQFRYYNYLYLKKDKCISQIKELEEQRIEIQKLLIKIAKQLKFMNTIVKDEKKDFEISTVAFETRMIYLENIAIELKEKEKMEVSIYDIDILEKQFQVEVLKKDLLIKTNKKVKLFS